MMKTTKNAIVKTESYLFRGEDVPIGILLLQWNLPVELQITEARSISSEACAVSSVRFYGWKWVRRLRPSPPPVLGRSADTAVSGGTGVPRRYAPGGAGCR